MRTWVKWSAWICLSLMLWTAAEESTHNHPSFSDAASCALCLAAHTANPAPYSADTTPAFATVGVLDEEVVVANARFEFSDLEIRGPPIL
jgi:hypothetical protein